jgi:hypothetical protein
MRMHGPYDTAHHIEENPQGLGSAAEEGAEQRWFREEEQGIHLTACVHEPTAKYSNSPNRIEELKQHATDRETKVEAASSRC